MEQKKAVKVITVVLLMTVIGSCFPGCSLFQKKEQTPVAVTELLVDAGTDTSFITQDYTVRHQGDYDVLVFNDEASARAAEEACYNNYVSYSINTPAALDSLGDLSLISYASKNNISKTASNTKIVVIIDSGASADRANERYSVIEPEIILEGEDDDEVTVDDPLDCYDDAEHGNLMCDYILNNDADNAYIISIKAFDSSGSADTATIMEALEYMIDNDIYADYVLMAFSMYVDSEDVSSFTDMFNAMAAIKTMSTTHGRTCKTIASAGNSNHGNANATIPAVWADITVGSKKANGSGNITALSQLTDTTGIGSCVDCWVTASSTSEAAAKYVGYALANRLSNNTAIQGGTVTYEGSQPDPDSYDFKTRDGKYQQTVWTEASIRGAGYNSSAEFAANIVAACDNMVSTGAKYNYCDCITFTHIAYIYAYEHPHGLQLPRGANPWAHGHWSKLKSWVNNHGYGSVTTRNGFNSYNVPGVGPDLNAMNFRGIRNWHNWPGNGDLNWSYASDAVSKHRYARFGSNILLLDADEEVPPGYDGLYLRPGDMLIFRNSKKWHHMAIYGGRTSGNSITIYDEPGNNYGGVAKKRKKSLGSGTDFYDLLWDTLNEGSDTEFTLDAAGKGDIGFYIIHYDAFGESAAYANYNKVFDLDEYNDLCEAYGEDVLLNSITITASSAPTNGEFYYGQNGGNRDPLMVVTPGATIASMTLAQMKKTVSGNRVIFSWPDSQWGTNNQNVNGSAGSSIPLQGLGPIWHWEGQSPPNIVFTETWAIDAAYPE